MCWWQWQDIFQFSRGLPGCEDGLLSDGLVDRFRLRKPNYAVMAEFFDLIEHAPEPFFEVEEYLGAGAMLSEALVPLDLSEFRGKLNDSLWTAATAKGAKNRFFKTPIRIDGNRGMYVYRDLKILSGLRCDIPEGHPIILRGERSRINVTFGRSVSKVYLFGAVTYFDGYPIRGIHGEVAAKLTLVYADGTVDELSMRHGLEIASASLIGYNSRVDAHAALAPRIAKITQDYDWEVYAVNLLVVAADKQKTLQTLTIEAIDVDFDPVVFAISVS
jgi:hypothetical protein